MRLGLQITRLPAATAGLGRLLVASEPIEDALENGRQKLGALVELFVGGER